MHGYEPKSQTCAQARRRKRAARSSPTHAGELVLSDALALACACSDAIKRVTFVRVVVERDEMPADDRPSSGRVRWIVDGRV